MADMLSRDGERRFLCAHTGTMGFFDVISCELDERLGKGYAKANPALVGDLVRAAGDDYSATMIAEVLNPEFLGSMNIEKRVDETKNGEL